MSTQAYETTDRSFLTTDDRQFGFAALRPAEPGVRTTQHVCQSDEHLDVAWAILLQGELEEAVDTVLLRAALASTPTLTGRNHRLLS